MVKKIFVAGALLVPAMFLLTAMTGTRPSYSDSPFVDLIPYSVIAAWIICALAIWRSVGTTRKRVLFIVLASLLVAAEYVALAILGFLFNSGIQ